MVVGLIQKLFDYTFIFGYLTFGLLFFRGCTSDAGPSMRNCLKLSGNNRIELEKVLLHYKNDSLKLEAAKFLICNMPGQYSVMSEGIDSCQSIIQRALQKGYVDIQDKRAGQNFLQLKKDTIYDINVITADYLIENIDLSFEAWRSNEWNQGLSFDDFCELILPYRIADEPLTRWRVKYYERYAPLLDSLYAGNDAVVACDSLCLYLKKESFFYNTDFSTPHFRADFLLDNRFGTCRDGCDIGIYAMRAVGLPVAIDILPYSPEYQLGHLWNVMYDVETRKYLPFWYTQFSPERNDNFTDGRKKGKVYRMCYTTQPHSNYPFRQNKRMKDVTAEYFGKNQVQIKVETPDVPQNSPIYLGVFSSSGWQLVCSGTYDPKKNEALFKDLEPRVIYQPLVFDGSKLRHANHPFMLTDTDKLQFFVPNPIEKETVRLTRKYPLRQNTANFRHNMLGAKIEGYLDSLFRNPAILHVIADTIKTNFNRVPAQSNHSFRYVRYRSAPEKKTEMGEITFLRKDGSNIPIKNISVDAKMYRPKPHFNVKNCIDDDPLSFYSHYELGLSVLFEFTQPESVYSIIFIPRNDDNFIRPGDEYELFYNAGVAGWKTLSAQQATSFTLTYSNVPKGALLWLKNKTRGREEQVFTYENNRQRFGTFDEYEKNIVIE